MIKNNKKLVYFLFENERIESHETVGSWGGLYFIDLLPITIPTLERIKNRRKKTTRRRWSDENKTAWEGIKNILRKHFSMQLHHRSESELAPTNLTTPFDPLPIDINLRTKTNSEFFCSEKFSWSQQFTVHKLGCEIKSEEKFLNVKVRQKPLLRSYNFYIGFVYCSYFILVIPRSI